MFGSLEITMHNDGSVSVMMGTEVRERMTDNAVLIACKNIAYSVKNMRRQGDSDADIEKVICASPDYALLTNVFGTPAEEVESTPADILTQGIAKLIDFFSEFSFTPSFRFVNTLSHRLAESEKSAKEYVTNYFALMDNSYANEINAKMKSAEFKSIMSSIKQYGETPKTVNSRFKVYYGSAGCGKTTKAMAEADNRCVVCNATMLPSDLMEDFCFENGQPSFKPSVLWECMEQGKTIVLDEINLLPFDSLRFLQGICDGKATFSYKNRPVTIAEGFQIIGTMNLTLGGMTYALPEPLVDRCADIKSFTLTADMLAKSIM